MFTGASMLRSPSLSIFMGLAACRFLIPPRELALPAFDEAFLAPRPLGAEPLALGPVGPIVVMEEWKIARLQVLDASGKCAGGRIDRCSSKQRHVERWKDVRMKRSSCEHSMW